MKSITERWLRFATRLVLFVSLMFPLSTIPSSCDAPTGLELPDKEEEEKEEEDDDEDEDT